MNRRSLSLLPFVLACGTAVLACGTAPVDSGSAGAGDADTDSDSDTDTDTNTDTDTDTDTGPACSTVNSGDDWAWSGECPQMRTPVAITVEACTMTLDYDSVGGMTMGMPYSATIEGDQITFADDNSVDGCVGTVETADKITGTCSGCEFTLRR